MACLDLPHIQQCLFTHIFTVSWYCVSPCVVVCRVWCLFCASLHRTTCFLWRHEIPTIFSPRTTWTTIKRCIMGKNDKKTWVEDDEITIEQAKPGMTSWSHQSHLTKTTLTKYHIIPDSPPIPSLFPPGGDDASVGWQTSAAGCADEDITSTGAAAAGDSCNGTQGRRPCHVWDCLDDHGSYITLLYNIL